MSLDAVFLEQCWSGRYLDQSRKYMALLVAESNGVQFWFCCNQQVVSFTHGSTAGLKIGTTGEATLRERCAKRPDGLYEIVDFRPAPIHSLRVTANNKYNSVYITCAATVMATRMSVYKPNDCLALEHPFLHKIIDIEQMVPATLSQPGARINVRVCRARHPLYSKLSVWLVRGVLGAAAPPCSPVMPPPISPPAESRPAVSAPRPATARRLPRPLNLPLEQLSISRNGERVLSSYVPVAPVQPRPVQTAQRVELANPALQQPSPAVRVRLSVEEQQRQWLCVAGMRPAEPQPPRASRLAPVPVDPACVVDDWPDLPPPSTPEPQPDHQPLFKFTPPRNRLGCVRVHFNDFVKVTRFDAEAAPLGGLQQGDCDMLCLEGDERVWEMREAAMDKARCVIYGEDEKEAEEQEEQLSFQE